MSQVAEAGSRQEAAQKQPAKAMDGPASVNAAGGSAEPHKTTEPAAATRVTAGSGMFLHAAPEARHPSSRRTRHL